MPEKRTLVFTRGVLWGSLIVAVVALVCIRLGFWQLDRLQQKRDRNAAVRQRMAQPPASISALSDSSGLIFRRVILNGELDDDHTIIIAGRSLRGSPGVHILTPMRVGGAAVLVNRGWMPSADAARVDLESIRETTLRNVQAIIVPLPESYGRFLPGDTFLRVWHGMDNERLRRQFPYHILPFIAQILPHPGQPAYPIRLRAPEMNEGPHMGYAVQWFSFAAIAIIGWSALLLRRKPGQAQND